MNSLLNRTFYALKPLIPRSIQIFLRRQRAHYKRKKYLDVWPIDPQSSQPEEWWRGWPGKNKFALVLSHDVDTKKGYRNVFKLADLEEQMGFHSQFNFVPERYGTIEMSLLEELRKRGFGVGVHGLKHDGKLFSSRKIFNERANKINSYLDKWGTRSFTTPSMIRKAQWISELDVDYCVSSFDTDPFEPQSEGIGTIFPYWVENKDSKNRYLELPYTLVQDFTLFVILGEKKIDIWQKKINWIRENAGMALLNSHPDYMSFSSDNCKTEEYPVELYKQFLVYINSKFERECWKALPKDVYNFVNSQSNLVNG
jgi:hypothetical protein